MTLFFTNRLLALGATERPTSFPAVAKMRIPSMVTFEAVTSTPPSKMASVVLAGSSAASPWFGPKMVMALVIETVSVSYTPGKATRMTSSSAALSMAD